MSERDDLIQEMEARIDEANAEIERMKESDAAEGRKLDALRAKRQEAVELLEEIRMAGDDALAVVRLKMSNVWEEFDAMIRAA